MNDPGPAGGGRWAGPLLASLVDQALFSGANFALQLLLARWLAPSAYGTFAVAFAAFLFLSGFYNALVLEPMSVLGAQREAASGYVPGLVRLHFVLTLPASLALAVLAAATPAGDLRAAWLGLALGLPLALLFWLARGACYLRGHPRRAALGSAAYAAALLVPLLALWTRQPTTAASPFVAFTLLGLAGLVGFAVARPAFAGHSAVPLAWRDLLREHWSYGRWVVPTAVANGLYAVAFVPLLAAIAGLAEAGSYRALQNLVLPVQQALTAVALLALPRLARQAAGTEGAAFDASVRRLVLVACGGSVAYAAVLVAAGPWLLGVLYGRGEYAVLGWAVPLLAVSVVLSGLALTLSTVLRARRRPDVILWSKAAGAVVLLGVGWPAITALGLRGALWTLVAATAAEVVVVATRARGTS
jgi:O-antigen/teichoic acid export membrane protein